MLLYDNVDSSKLIVIFILLHFINCISYKPIVKSSNQCSQMIVINAIIMGKILNVF